MAFVQAGLFEQAGCIPGHPQVIIFAFYALRAKFYSPCSSFAIPCTMENDL